MHPRKLEQRRELAEETIAKRVAELAAQAGVEPDVPEHGRNPGVRSMFRLEAVAATLEKLPDPVQPEPEPEPKPKSKPRPKKAKE